MLDFLRRKFPAYVETGLNLVDAMECARGHVQAMEKGRSGERYILGGENLTLKQILDRLGAITGLPSPKMKLPYFVALATGVVDEMVTGRFLGREPRATIDAVRMGRKKMFVSLRRRNGNWDGGWCQWMGRCDGRWSGSGRSVAMTCTNKIVACIVADCGDASGGEAADLAGRSGRSNTVNGDIVCS